MAVFISFTNHITRKKGFKRGEEIIVDAIYDECVSSFGTESFDHKPFATVCIGSKCGLIDETGKVVVPIEYQEAYYLFNDLFVVRKEDKEIKDQWSCGVINLKGEIIIPFDYQHIYAQGCYIRCFSSAKSERYSKYRILDAGDRVFKYFSEKDEVWFNGNGKLLHKGKGACEDGSHLITKEKEKLGLMDSTGKIVLRNQYDEIHCPSDNRFIVKKGDADSWFFGVLNEKEDTIVPFKYKYICPYHDSFFECYKEAKCTKTDWNDLIRDYSYSELTGIIWYNHDGAVIYKGQAKILSPFLLAVEKRGLWGVLNQSKVRIVNFLYDSILMINDKIAVSKDEKIGLVGNNGELLITPSYNSIECVSMKDSKSDNIIGYPGLNGIIYGNYNSEHIFDTTAPSKHLRRKRIYYGTYYRDKQILIEFDKEFDWNKPFILSYSDYAELFTMEDGIISESKSESIDQITEKSYAVKRNGKWGVFRIDTKELIIPCVYDRIIYEGGHVALLCSGNRWGAKSLIPPSHPLSFLSQVDIPVEYLEIKILESSQFYYGAKRERKVFDKIYTGYTILCADGKQPKGMESFHDTDSQFVFFNRERILSSQDKKWGFISIYGYDSIPFKYDLIEKREDDNFDVRIDEKWGVLNLSGKEIVAVKYSERIPKTIKDAVVTDYDSECCGILSEDGYERIPSIYEHLMIEDKFVFFGYGGYEGHNFFSDYDRAKWGCLNEDGELLIPPTYDCFSIRDGFIFAGRDGFMVSNSGSEFLNRYTGVYDMFTLDGSLIIGGFNECQIEDNLFYFLLNGTWKINHSNNKYSYLDDDSFYLDKTNASWLTLDKNLQSVKRGNKKRITFNKGFIFKVSQKKEGGKTINYYNFDILLLTKFKPFVQGDYLIAREENGSKAIRLSDGMTSDCYDRVHHVREDLFYVIKGNLAGLVSFDNRVLLPLDYFALTYPVGPYFFAFKKEENNKCSVSLVTIGEGNISSRIAISSRDYPEIIKNIRSGMFKIILLPNLSGLRSICVPRPSLFDQNFCSEINSTPQITASRYLKKFPFHCFTNSSALEEREYPEIGDNNDSNDDWSLQDTWDAMTDGAYGDMPEGFDGDFGFMGR